MKVISINSLPKFDIKLNDQYNMIIPSVVKAKEVIDIQNIEIEYPADWRNFMSSREVLHVTILNTQNDSFDRLIDFDNEDLCEKIEYLTIYGFIGHISDKIQQLRNLKSLYVYDMDSISPSIGTLKKLEELILEHCYQLDFIPFEMYEIKSLRKLTINSLGYYENLSPRINRLVNLEYLTLKDHHPYLSDEITQLHNLKCLDIERPYDCIYDIPNLEVLHARVFKSDSLKGIHKLNSLKELWLDIRELSDELNSLTSLKYLIIYNYPGESLPDLSQLTSLEVLVLHDCNSLTSIPDFILNLPNLKYLGLRCLNNLKTIPVEINQIPNLKYLDLTKSEDLSFYELPEFRSGLFVYRMNSWNSYERLN